MLVEEEWSDPRKVWIKSPGLGEGQAQKYRQTIEDNQATPRTLSGKKNSDLPK